ncbi:MAG: TetR/AcrR family transcriptional regulator [Nonlabens sp.]
MDKILYNLKVEINNKIYIKDPETTQLGKKIIQYSIIMIHDLGFEQFTFRKLGKEIGSNESSIYRYFENKHKLLLYLTSWYWSWLEYQLVFQTMPFSEPRHKLLKAIEILTADTSQDSTYDHINEVLLNEIIISEYSKSYLTKEVDRENKDGYFQVYKRLVGRLSDMVLAVNDSYSYPSSLSSMIIDGALHQHFLKGHFQAITDCNENVTPTDYFKDLINRVL